MDGRDEAPVSLWRDLETAKRFSDKLLPKQMSVQVLHLQSGHAMTRPLCDKGASRVP
jgi:hypothetical protein